LWTGWGKTVGIVSARRISRAGGAIAWATPLRLIGLQQLQAFTGPAQATQASRINGVVRRVHGTLFADDGPNNHRPKATQLVPLQNCKTW
jgi:hypothetical protein